MDTAKAQAVIAGLREEIRRRESSLSHAGLGCVPSGFEALDSLLPGGGFPRGRVVELSGARASGKLSLALMALARATRSGSLVAFVDPLRELYPPAARALGADLSKLLVVRPEEPGLCIRVASLLARSKAFGAVALDAAALGGQPQGPLSRRLLEAAETGRAALIVLCEGPSGLDATLRISVERASETELELCVERSRLGPPGRSAHAVLPLPEQPPTLRPEEKALERLVEGPALNEER
jgi:hypothetical protein